MIINVCLWLFVLLTTTTLALPADTGHPGQTVENSHPTLTASQPSRTSLSVPSKGNISDRDSNNDDDDDDVNGSNGNENGDGSIPPYAPVVTPPPDQASALSELGYYQTTFYTCADQAGSEHCGWHVPVVKSEASSVSSQGGKGSKGTGAVIVVTSDGPGP